MEIELKLLVNSQAAQALRHHPLVDPKTSWSRLLRELTAGRPDLAVGADLVRHSLESNIDGLDLEIRNETAFPLEGKAVADWGFRLGVYYYSSMAKR